MSLPSMRAFTSGNDFRASIAAFTNTDMKPIFAPCFFSNFSLYFARRSWMAVMSASLNVVSVAVVFCDSNSRSAIRRRIGDMGCRVIRDPGAGAGGGDVGRGAAGGPLDGFGAD